MHLSLVINIKLHSELFYYKSIMKPEWPCKTNYDEKSNASEIMYSYKQMNGESV